MMNIIKQIVNELIKKVENQIIYNDDCFNVFPLLEDKSIDLVLVDLPYNQTNCEWDIAIDLEKMWIELKRICKKKCLYVFFTTTKFGNTIINSNPKWFKYDLVWEKSKKVGFLCANKMPLRKHEMVYIFGDNTGKNDIGNNRNIELRKYSKIIYKEINKTKKEIFKEMGNTKLDHFFRFDSSQFGLPKKETYDKMIDIFKLTDIINYSDLKNKWEKKITKKKTYNPQKTKGTPYKIKRDIVEIGIYGVVKRGGIDNKGDRHPHSILKFNNPKKSLHPTQKPVNILEWLIKTYSNKGDIVLDFTMGSGTTGIACINTERKFIGIEMNKKIYETAKERLNKHNRVDDDIEDIDKEDK